GIGPAGSGIPAWARRRLTPQSARASYARVTCTSPGRAPSLFVFLWGKRSPGGSSGGVSDNHPREPTTHVYPAREGTLQDSMADEPAPRAPPDGGSELPSDRCPNCGGPLKSFWDQPE